MLTVLFKIVVLLTKVPKQHINILAMDKILCAFEIGVMALIFELN